MKNLPASRLSALLLAAAIGASAPAPSQTSPGNQRLWAIGTGFGDGSSSLYVIESWSTNPVARELGETGLVLTDLAIHPTTGELFAIDAAAPNNLYKLDRDDGSPRLIGPLTGFSNQTALEFDATGQLWMSGAGVYTDVALVDVATGQATVVSSQPYGTLGDLAFDVDGTLHAVAAMWMITAPANNGGVVTGRNYQQQIGDGLEIDNRGVIVSGGFTWNYPSQAFLRTYDPVTRDIGPMMEVAGLPNLGLAGLAFSDARAIQPYGAGVSEQQIDVRWEVPPGSPPSAGHLEVSGLAGSAAGRAVVMLAALGPAKVLLPWGPALLVDPTTMLALPLPPGSEQGELSLQALQAALQNVHGLYVQIFSLQSSLMQSSMGLAVNLLR